jgi:branched-chain amino acid transport system permease protein|tara:strand:- start:203 stop:1420 length:1218 start_codon:yes stop_codon:yes gene_type:complete
MNKQQVPLIAGVIIISFLMIFPFVYTANNYPYVMHIMIAGFFYAILTSSWSMLAGYGGQFSFGHMGFTGIGAYTTALFCHYIYLSPEATNICTEFAVGSQYLIIVNPIGITSSTLVQDCLREAMSIWDGSVEVTPMPVWLGIILGIAMGGLFGLLIGLLVLPLRAAYLALFTLGFTEILRAVISSELNITRGQAGLELPKLFENGITIFGRHFDKTDPLPPYFVMLFLLFFCLGVLYWLAQSKFGLFIRALREDQDAAAALGVNTTKYKVMLFVITSMMAAAAGAFFAHYIGIISPNNLMILQMSLVVSMAVIAGIENIFAAAIGAIIIEFTLETLRTSFDVPLLGVEVDMTVWRLVVFGALLMITLRLSRNGIIAPIINYFLRGHVADETVAKRKVSDNSEESA